MISNNSKTTYTKEDFYNEEWLSPKDIENQFNLSHATVSKLIHTKGFPMLKIGRSIRINVKDFKEFIDAYMNHTINLK